MEKENLKSEILKLKMELATVIMGYEQELRTNKVTEMSDFSKGCMERYFQLVADIKKDEYNVAND